ncbi:MAG: hypothetical protein JSV74_00325 [Dehalococcoidia bacterium]|nr:MAG: hypothetical protein JSV74_00325 [Dehalococcoidia bacterium]
MIFEIDDRVMCRDEGGEVLTGTIIFLNKNEYGESTGYVVQLDDNRIIGCSRYQIARIDTE